MTSVQSTALAKVSIVLMYRTPFRSEWWRKQYGELESVLFQQLASIIRKERDWEQFSDAETVLDANKWLRAHSNCWSAYSDFFQAHEHRADKEVRLHLSHANFTKFSSARYPRQGMGRRPDAFVAHFTRYCKSTR